MEFKSTHVNLKIQIRQNADGTWTASSDDPSIEPITAATKPELFQKMRERATALLGDRVPAELLRVLDAGATASNDSAMVVNLAKTRNIAVQPTSYIPTQDSTPLASQGTGLNVWKVLFFLLLAAVAVWFLLHRR